MDDSQRIHRIRPYYWGAIYLRDAECLEDFDIDFHSDPGPVSSTTSHIAVVVIHPSAVDTDEVDVTLDLCIKEQRAQAMAYEVALDLPSGRLYVGDADDDDELALRPGRWLLQFALDSPTDARHVEIVVSPLLIKDSSLATS